MKSLIRKIGRLLNFISLLLKHLWMETGQYLRIFLYHHKYARSPEVILANLRFLSHALDKGLCVTGRQTQRGFDKYTACKKIIRELEKTPLSDEPTLIWARKKIEAYERSQKSTDVLKGVPVEAPADDERQKILNFIRTRRSVRNFKAEKIAHNILSKMIDLARWAPNSCCRQSVFFYVCETPEKINQCMSITLGATCFSDTVPCFICVCGDMRFYPLIDKGLLYIDGALAAENLLLAAHAYGIEGTILNWRQYMRAQEKKLRDVLGIAPFHSVIINIALGYPAFMPPTPARKELNRVWKLTESR